MKVNHKTFTGGYKFHNFEGQPPKVITQFKPVKDMTGVVIEPGKSVIAADVLDALRLTWFSEPMSANTSSVGKIEPYDVKDIVVNMVEAEPYTLPMMSLINEETKGQFISGLEDIHSSYPRAKVTLIIGEDQRNLVQILSSEVRSFNWIEIATITSKYPANRRELAVPLVLDKKYPVGYGSTHLGVLYLGIKDVLCVARVVSGNKAADTVYLALAGSGWKENHVLEVQVGIRLQAICERYLGEGEIRLVKNSILTGEQLTEEDVVTYDTDVIIAVPEDRRRQSLFFLRGGKDSDSFTNAFLSKIMPKVQKKIDTNLHGERRACLSCNYCQSSCPVGLIPHLIHKHADKNIINKRLAEYRTFDCIECGLCNYVCLSKIEVLSSIKVAKDKLEKAEISHKDYVLPQCDLVAQIRREVASGE